MKRNTGALLESILGALMERPAAPRVREEPEMIEEIEAIEETEELKEPTEAPSAQWGICDRPTNEDLLRKLNMILALLTNRCFGLCEIKKEVKEIEENTENGNGGIVSGPITTGPFFIRTGQNNAVNVLVQNLEDSLIDVEVKLVGIGACPVLALDNASLEDIDSCCTEDATLTAAAGNWEVVVCPTPEPARVRAFVSVHGGNAATSAIEYVFRASEMLPATCAFCDLAVP